MAFLVNNLFKKKWNQSIWNSKVPSSDHFVVRLSAVLCVHWLHSVTLWLIQQLQLLQSRKFCIKEKLSFFRFFNENFFIFYKLCGNFAFYYWLYVFAELLYSEQKGRKEKRGLFWPSFVWTCWKLIKLLKVGFFG